ncbi:MAG: hypothetical protein RMK84_04940 [Oscillochloridaceae bacterium]|nr:hypothetical protein [Chloroflexaceae bacterium]MDW8389449.1 hypothetical protein [Oscillochloridaceae bacterium]
MIHATTHASAEGALYERTVPVRRIGPRTLNVLIGIELLLLLSALAWALLHLLPPATPLATATDLRLVVDAIRDRLSGAVADPLVPVGDGYSARASNLRGLQLDGQVYYYYVEGAKNFDPLSRGVIGKDQVEILLRDASGDHAFVIYRVY